MEKRLKELQEKQKKVKYLLAVQDYERMLLSGLHPEGQPCWDDAEDLANIVLACSRVAMKAMEEMVQVLKGSGITPTEMMVRVRDHAEKHEREQG